MRYLLPGGMINWLRNRIGFVRADGLKLMIWSYGSTD